MQYRYDYAQQGKEAFAAGLPRSSCPNRWDLPATYTLDQILESRWLWCRGYDDAARNKNPVGNEGNAQS